MTTILILVLLAGLGYFVYLKRAKILSWFKSHDVTINDKDSDSAD